MVTIEELSHLVVKHDPKIKEIINNIPGVRTHKGEFLEVNYGLVDNMSLDPNRKINILGPKFSYELGKVIENEPLRYKILEHYKEKNENLEHYSEVGLNFRFKGTFESNIDFTSLDTFVRDLRMATLDVNLRLHIYLEKRTREFFDQTESIK